MRAGAFATCAALAACSSSAGIPAAGGSVVPLNVRSEARSIQHVVILIQENRSFDNLFGTFPGVNGATAGSAWVKMKSGHYGDVKVPLVKHALLTGCDIDHSIYSFQKEYDHGVMDGFNQVGCNDTVSFRPAKSLPYQFVDPAQIQPYWNLAKEYVLSDNTFQTQASGSFTGHLDLIAGGTQLTQTTAVVDWPTSTVWGCDAPAGTLTDIITNTNVVEHNAPGSFPCYTFKTMRDLLDAKHVSWRYYVPCLASVSSCGGAGAEWNAFDAIHAVRFGTEWHTNIAPVTNVLTDAAAGHLPAVSWVVPDAANSDHPLEGSDTGPSWVAQVVNTIGKSPDWKSTVIFVVWDDWGGFYDHVAPPQPFRPFGELGFRVPMLIVSPYAKRGYIAHNTQYEFGSILKFIEQNWDLGNLGQSDAIANPVTDSFNFGQVPRTFKRIDAKYSRDYFLHQKPSNRPVDEE